MEGLFYVNVVGGNIVSILFMTVIALGKTVALWGLLLGGFELILTLIVDAAIIMNLLHRDKEERRERTRQLALAVGTMGIATLCILSVFLTGETTGSLNHDNPSGFKLVYMAQNLLIFFTMFAISIRFVQKADHNENSHT